MCIIQFSKKYLQVKEKRKVIVSVAVKQRKGEILGLNTTRRLERGLGEETIKELIMF